MDTICPINKMHDIQLDLLRELKRVCDNNKLNYYIACGTCLGALRHKGFIPWDHDIDVYMHIDDTEKLKKIADQFGKAYFLQSKESDPGSDSIILRLRNSKTTCITKDSIGLNCNQGFAIDIYPLYVYPKNPIVAHYYIIISYIYRLLVAERIPVNHGKIMGGLSKIVLILYSGRRRNKTREKIKKKLCSVRKGEYLLTYYGLDITLMKAILYNVEWFEEPKELLFSDEIFKGPSNPDLYLKKKYGNYMELPPEDKRYADIDDIIVADADRAYFEYKSVYIK